MAATLRSALRGTPPTCPLPPLPPSSEDRGSSSPALRSRFSAETLMIKPSPSKTLKSFFSTAAAAAANPAATEGGGSAPALLSSAVTTKRYHRRLSATQAARAAREEAEEHVRGSPPRLGHFPSARESRLNLETTTPSECEPSSPPPEQARRGSFAGITRSQSSRSRSRSSRPSLRGRTPSSGNGTGIGALDAAADKLAGVAREALGKLTTSGRHRTPRQQSSETSCSARDEGARQRNRETSADSSATSLSTTSSSSSGGVAHRRGRGRPLAELAATRPRPKHLPANPRPAAPPSPTIPPLKYTTRTTNTFRAHAVRVPSPEILRSHEYHDLFVRLDVGGQSSYMTTVATLFEAEDGGGKLGELVAALLFTDRRRVGEEEGSAASGFSFAGTESDRNASASHAAPAPPHSPFPFAADEIPLFDHGSSSIISFFDDPAASPSIDPLVRTAATALIGEHFTFSFPPLGDAPSPTTPTLRVSSSQNAQRVLLVPSPTLPSGIKHTSIYPDFGPSRASVAAVKAEGKAVLPAMVFDQLDLPPLQMASPLSSCSSSSSAGDSESPSSSSSPPDSFIDFGPGDTPNRPHFEVMREQLFRRQAGDAQDRLSLAPEGAAQVRQSLTYGKVQQPEDQISTIEALTNPASKSVASSSTHNGASSCREMDPAQLNSDPIKPETPRLKHAEARRQRLSPAARRSTSLADRTIDIFFDRTDFPISSPHLAEVGAGELATVYSALLAFLRGGAFPAVLSIPEFDQTMSVSVSSDSGTAVFLRPGSTAVMSYLATFETIKAEARWLGLQAAERACDRYIQHLHHLASAGTGGGSAVNRGARKMQGEKAQGREGWI